MKLRGTLWKTSGGIREHPKTLRWQEFSKPGARKKYFPPQFLPPQAWSAQFGAYFRLLSTTSN
jgi:hypothetical protein